MGGTLGRSSSSPAVGRKSGGMRKAATSSTPYLRNQYVRQEEIYRVKTKKAVNLLPPMHPSQLQASKKTTGGVQVDAVERAYQQMLEQSMGAQQRIAQEGYQYG